MYRRPWSLATPALQSTSLPRVLLMRLGATFLDGSSIGGSKGGSIGGFIGSSNLGRHNPSSSSLFNPKASLFSRLIAPNTSATPNLGDALLKRCTQCSSSQSLLVILFGLITTLVPLWSSSCLAFIFLLTMKTMETRQSHSTEWIVPTVLLPSW